MSGEENLNITNLDEISNNYETVFSRKSKFIFFLPLQLASIPANIFVLYHLFKIRNLRQSLPNHVLIALNIVSLIDVFFQQSGIMIFFKLNQVWPESYSYCLFLNYLDFVNYALNLHLTVWALFERQMFIFDPFFCRTRRRREIFHYASLILIILSTIIFYIGLIILNPCENHFDYHLSWCGDLCFLEDDSLYFYDWIFNGLIPMLLIILISIALLLRVIYHRYRVYQRFIWSKHRKLTIQLLILSALYTTCFSPTIITALMSKFLKDPDFAIEPQTVYLDYLPILARTLTPFLSIATLPVLSRKLKSYIARRNTAVVPRIL